MEHHMRTFAGAILLLATIVSASPGRAEPLKLLTEDYPPFNFLAEDKVTMTGMSTDVLRDMARRAHIEAEFALLPWKRAMLTAQEDANTCVYSAIRTPEREARYKWVGPLISDSLVLFARADRDIKIKSLEDVRAYMVGTYNGSLAIPLLDAKGVRIDVAPDDLSNLKKLAIGRIDLWVASQSTGMYMAKRAGVVTVKTAYVLGSGKDYEMYLACNKNLPDKTVNALNAILNQMRHDGTYARIQGNYR